MRFDLSISEFVKELYFGNELLVFDEHTWRPYCHIRDFARLIDIVLNAPKKAIIYEIFNEGGEANNFTKKMIVEAIVKQLPYANIKYGENGTDPRNYKVSFKKVRETLNFEPRYGVAEGIKELTEALEIGLFKDSIINKDQYGNYKVNYTR